MTTSSYFETITSKSALRRHTHKYPPLYRRNQRDLPAASGWSTRELFASRVVVSHVRGGVLKYRAPSSSAFLEPLLRLPSAELSKIIAPLPPGGEELTETELVHRLGGTAGMFWAALHCFTRAQSVQPVDADADDLEMPDVDNTAGIGAHGGSHLPSLVSPLPQRNRRQTQRHPDYVDSSNIQITSSSPAPDSHLSSSFASDNAGHVSREEHTRRALSEDATVQLASAFLRHALVHCPLQHVAAVGNPPPLLLEFSGVRRRMFAPFAHFGDKALELEATADGEVALLRRHATGRFVDRGEVPALLEAKKRFKLVREGRPVVTDYVLGQMVGEALTLRLSLAAAELGHGKDTVVIVTATRQYLCFLSFHIPDAYVEKVRFPNGLGFQNDDVYNDEDGELEREDDCDEDDEMEQEEDDEEEEGEEEEEEEGEEEEEFITVRATDWLDLGTERCRQLACDNIAALVGWQLKSQ
ncbi:hypothetical protein B0H63DRAFT_477693 [Podospora didyma]|uniref:Uncharacterized protein n=1 Tax=Podospora didyma TaxID=330526 RepID=A0AAE0KK32_9PEZI|nr:hypothetical protein B0H63DRAFT_477693 [Podospora didyma]